MNEKLDADVCQKIADLRRVYGTRGVADLLNSDELGKVKFADIPDTEFSAAIAKRILSNIRLYWKSWMHTEKETKDESC